MSVRSAHDGHGTARTVKSSSNILHSDVMYIVYRNEFNYLQYHMYTCLLYMLYHESIQ